MKKSSLFWAAGVVVIIIIGIFVWRAGMGSGAPRDGGSQQTASTTPTTTLPGSNPSTNPPTKTPGSGTPTPTSTGSTNHPTVSLNTSDGDIAGYHLVAANGMTLYEYNKDKANVSNCIGSCAALWPPYIVNARQATELSGGAGINGKIRAFTRTDGTLQVAYDNIPLYFYTGDKKPGDVKGQGLGGFATIAP